MKRLFLIGFISFFSIFCFAQSTWFGVKGGLTAGSQRWNNFDRDLLYKYHGDLILESEIEDRAFQFVTSLGYHPRGSAIRVSRFVLSSGDIFSPPTQEFIFHNAVFGFNIKQEKDFGGTAVPYYSVGLRAEYTFDTNLDNFSEQNTVFFIYPFPEFVRKFNYGFSASGGLQKTFGELVEGFIELGIHQDLSLQYDQFAIENVINPRNPGGAPITIGARQIRNFSAEISVGIKFLRKVVYIDDF